MQHRKEIDGLRALAVLPVIFFHAGFTTLSGGFVGVDVFYVISGYVITALILREMEAGTFSIARFYEKRLKRILPALVAVLLACMVPAWLWMDTSQLQAFSLSLIAVSTFTANILFWKTTDYFGAPGAEQPLLHTWSLAVEEQYYIFFPLAIVMLWPLGKRRLVIILSVIAALSLMLSEWGRQHRPDANFYLMPTRAWELLIGALIAFAGNRKPLDQWLSRETNKFLSLLGLGLILGSFLLLNEKMPLPSVYALLPTLGTGLIIAFAHPTNFVGRLLATPPLLGVGLISYSAYLWHQPLFAFARIRGGDDLPLSVFGALSLLSLALAWLSWRYIEQPFRYNLIKTRKAVFSSACAVSIVIASLGLAGKWTNGFESRYSPEQNQLLSYLHYPRQALYHEGTCFLETEHGFDEFSPQCYQDLLQHSGATLIWGDSHAASLSAGIEAANGDNPRISQLTASDCPPLIGYQAPYRPHCKAINDGVFSLIKKAKAPTVLLIANWINHAHEPNYYQLLENTVNAVHSTGAKVLIIGSLPHWSPTLPQLLVKDLLIQRTQPANLPEYRRSSQFAQTADIDNHLANIAAAQHSGFISMTSLLCKHEDCMAWLHTDGDPVPTAWDDAHLTREGSLNAGSLMMTKLRQTANPS